MDPISFTRQLVDVESISGNEGAVGELLQRQLQALGYDAVRIPVPTELGAAEMGKRFNVYATVPGQPVPRVVFSTHMDTVPPFFPSSEDGENIYGRGACDAKGILAAQVAASEQLRQQGLYVGLLFVVGEERDSLGASTANRQAPGSSFLVNGEPTDNRMAVASKGSLRVEVTAHGKLAHSAYPELGESAIDKLLEALHRLRAMKLPCSKEIGPSTLNIGVIEGGRAPNVVPDYARAQLQYRLVGPSDELRRQIVAAVGTLAQVNFVLDLAFVRLRTVEGLPTMVAAFTTDIPKLTQWGEPLLIGPGSIQVAHTEREFIRKQELIEAVDIYGKIARKLHG